jgi:hypothetical protein
MGGTGGAVSQVCVQSVLCRVYTTEGYESASLPFSCLYTELTRPFSSHKKVLCLGKSTWWSMTIGVLLEVLRQINSHSYAGPIRLSLEYI